MDGPLLHKPDDAARILGIGRTKLFELVAGGEIESVQIGTARRIPHRSLEDYVERLRSKSPVA